MISNMYMYYDIHLLFVTFVYVCQIMYLYSLCLNKFVYVYVYVLSTHLVNNVFSSHDYFFMVMLRTMAITYLCSLIYIVDVLNYV